MNRYQSDFLKFNRRAEYQEEVVPEADRIIRLKTVLDRTGLSRSTLYRKVAEGTFPRQLRIAARCAGWRESAVDAWLNDPICYRDADRRGA